MYLGSFHDPKKTVSGKITKVEKLSLLDRFFNLESIKNQLKPNQFVVYPFANLSKAEIKARNDEKLFLSSIFTDGYSCSLVLARVLKNKHTPKGEKTVLKSKTKKERAQIEREIKEKKIEFKEKPLAGLDPGVNKVWTVFSILTKDEFKKLKQDPKWFHLFCQFANRVDGFVDPPTPNSIVSDQPLKFDPAVNVVINASYSTKR